MTSVANSKLFLKGLKLGTLEDKAFSRVARIHGYGVTGKVEDENGTTVQFSRDLAHRELDFLLHTWQNIHLWLPTEDL